MEKKEYFIGLDMGTSSVGWAVTDTNYNLLRAKGKDMWGVRLFSEASTAADRRGYRTSRRNLKRKKVREAYLREIFEDEINKVDPSFFERLKETNFFICKNDKDLKFSKNVDIVLDYFSLMLNTKKVINKLYSNLELVADDYYEQKNDINSKMITVLDDIILAAGHEEVVFDLDFKWQDMFKIYGLKLDESYDNLVEKLSMYIKVLSEYTDVKVIFFVNIKSFLATEDLDKLYDMANYQKIIIILLESRESIERGREIRYIIDKDNCFIDGN